MPVPKQSAFDRFYHWWNRLHAGAIVILVVGADFAPVKPAALLLLAAWGAVVMLALFLTAWRVHPDGPGRMWPNILCFFPVDASVR
jgi:hypothetical protein